MKSFCLTSSFLGCWKESGNSPLVRSKKKSRDHPKQHCSNWVMGMLDEMLRQIWEPVILSFADSKTGIYLDVNKEFCIFLCCFFFFLPPSEILRFFGISKANQTGPRFVIWRVWQPLSGRRCLIIFLAPVGPRQNSAVDPGQTVTTRGNSSLQPFWLFIDLPLYFRSIKHVPITFFTVS